MPRQLTTRLGLVAAAFLFLSLGRYVQPVTGEKKRLAVGQPGVDMAFLSYDEQQRGLAAAVPDLVAQAVARRADLLVLPEGLTLGGSSLPPRIPLSGPPPLPLILGGQRGENPAYQTAFGYDLGTWDYADKTRLVIFGEFVPFRNFLPFLDGFRLPNGDLQPGEVVKTLTVGGMKVGPLICFEALFPDLAARQSNRGSQVLAVLSNEDWFLGTPAIGQLRAGAIFRAVESGLPLVKAACSGESFIVDPRGRVLAEAPTRTRRLLTVETEVPSGASGLPYREAFPWLAAVAIGGAFWPKKKAPLRD